MNRNFTVIDEEFVCENCGKQVRKLGYSCRNHCPYCLYSKHVDVNPGDRAETCQGKLRPVGIEIDSKKGYVIIFKCEKCGKIRKNKAAEDDNMDLIIKLSANARILKGRGTMEKVRIYLRRILTVLLVIWMIAVFCLSNQNGDTSGSLSLKIASWITRGNESAAENIESVVRKVAHVTEYAAGAMIFYGITMTFPDLSRKSKIAMTIGFVAFYAATDEFHQLFIDARNGSIVDVLIDIGGGVLGVVAMCFVEGMIATMDNRVQEDLQEPKVSKARRTKKKQTES